jgi:restriction endonuclease S subunit
MNREVALKNICKIRLGHAFRGRVESTLGGELAVVQPRDISGSGALETGEIAYVDLSLLKPAQLLRSGDILLVGRGRICAAVYRDECAPHCIASGALFVLSVNSSVAVSPDFIAIYLNSHEGRLALSRVGARTTAAFLNRSNLKEVEIPIPDIKTQQSLVALSQSKRRFLDLATRKATILDRVIGSQFNQTAAI